MNLANNLTVLRILLVPVFVGSLVYYSPERQALRLAAAALFLAACATDALDGYLARKLNQKTELGSTIDPIADKLLLLSGFLSLSFMGHLPEAMRIPAWVTLAVISRDGLILIGSVVIFITTGRLKTTPLFIGKATTVLQMLTLFACLVSTPPGIRSGLFLAVFVLTLASGLSYIRMGSRLLQPS